MDRVGRIVYINLDERKDRREHSEAEFAKMSITNYTRFSAYRTPGTAVGCSASHTEVVRQAIQDGVSSLLVMEDDFFFTVDRETLDARLNYLYEHVSDYDVVMLDYMMYHSEPIDPVIGRVYEARTATAYLVAGRYLPTLLECYDKALQSFIVNPHVHWLYTNDVAWNTLQQKDKWYYFVERLVYQHGGYSDLGQKYIEKHTYH